MNAVRDATEDGMRPHWKHETEVDYRGDKRTVFFDYEGDGIIVWCFPGEDTCGGPQGSTDSETADIYQALWAYLEDWWAPRPEDDL